MLPFAAVWAGCQTPEVVDCDSGCSESEETAEEDVPWAPLILGHRGTGSNDKSNPFVENTVLSFQQAMVEGADGVEFDVHPTSDGVMVLLHDELLDGATTRFLESGAGELLAEDLRDVHHTLSKITGEFGADALLGEIFSSFCIGK